jgi:hypothetical protein
MEGVRIRPVGKAERTAQITLGPPLESSLCEEWLETSADSPPVCLFRVTAWSPVALISVIGTPLIAQSSIKAQSFAQVA